MLHVNENVAIANGENLDALQSALPGATQALLALLALRAMHGRRITIWLPEAMAAYKARQEGSLLLAAEVEGMRGGVLLTRKDIARWEVTVHT